MSTNIMIWNYSIYFQITCQHTFGASTDIHGFCLHFFFSPCCFLVLMRLLMDDLEGLVFLLVFGIKKALVNS